MDRKSEILIDKMIMIPCHSLTIKEILRTVYSSFHNLTLIHPNKKVNGINNYKSLTRSRKFSKQLTRIKNKFNVRNLIEKMFLDRKIMIRFRLSKYV